MHYQLDNYIQRNPYAIWLQQGHPVYPPYYLLQSMRDAAVSYGYAQSIVTSGFANIHNQFARALHTCMTLDCVL